MQPGGEQPGDPVEQDLFTEHQDKLQIARTPQPADNQEPSNVNSVRCIDGRIVRPRQHEEESPSTACNSSTVSMSTRGRVRLGAAEPPCFGQPPGLVQVPSIPVPPPPPRTLTKTSSYAEVYPRQWTPLRAKPKTPPGGPPSGSNNQSTGSGGASEEVI